MAGSLLINALIFQITVCIVLISETTSYDEILIEQGRLCKLKDYASAAVVRLDAKGEGSSKIVTQRDYFASWTGRYHFRCSFQVKAPDDYGIYAVIQALNFRKNETTRECIDYVKFEQAPRNLYQKFVYYSAQKAEKTFCGRIYPAQAAEEGFPDKAAEIAENSFKVNEGLITVTIYVGRERLLPTEKLDVKIAFTSFKKDCSSKPREDLTQCNYCEWIWKGLYLDKVQNCPYLSCIDEGSCKNLEVPFEVRDFVSKETGTKVTITAVVTILILFLIFAICLWICRRSQKYCWSTSNGNPSRMEMNRTRQLPRFEEISFPSGDLAGPTAPSAPPLPDLKDPPPSYESLYPDK